jgi:serine/threonine protein kinase
MALLLKSTYRLRGELFRDSLSRSFDATIETSQRAVIVTQYDPKWTDATCVQQLIERSEQLLRIRLPFITPLIDYHFDGRSFFAVYDCPKPVQPLLRVLKAQRRVEINQLMTWCSDTLSAMDSVEKHGLYHGNISLHSLVIDSENQISAIHTILHSEIIRHGITKMSQCDSVMFLAPEQFENTPIDSRVDVYAIGIMAYLFFSNQWPYEFSIDVIRMKSMTAVPPRPFIGISATLPAHIEQMIGIAISKAPSSRFKSIYDFKMQFSYHSAPPTPPLAPAPDPIPPSAPSRHARPYRGFQWKPGYSKLGLGMGILMIILFIINHIYVGYVTGIPVSIVPDLRGKSAQEASHVLEKMNLRSEIAGDRVDYSVAEGAILETRPPAGREVKENRIIMLYISKRGSEFAVPDFVGQTIAQAEAIIPDAKFKIKVASENYSKTIPAGEIISQSPSANTKTKPNATIIVVVSKGREESATDGGPH